MKFKNKKVVVMGLGLFGGGLEVTRYFVNHGAEVLVTDLRDETQLKESLELLKDLPVKFRLGEHCEEDFINADLVIANPGVKDDSPYLKIAYENNIPVDTEINIFLQNSPAPVIGITGSNGKSTTTAMINHILETAGYKTWLGGNIGKSLLGELSNIKPEHKVILELSSFQLQRVKEISPNVAVVTNFSRNHVNWHGSMENYAKAKQNILKFQNKSDFCILNGQDPEVSQWKNLGESQKLIFNSSDGDIFIKDNKIYSNDIPIIHTNELPLKGRANQENAMAAIAAALTQSIAPEKIAETLKTFKGLPHRMAFLGNFSGRLIYEDSDATTPESTIAAIEALNRPLILIAGGSDKGSDYSLLGDAINQKVDLLILFGETGPKIQASLKGKRNTKVINVVNLEEAVQKSSKLSGRGYTIILSPASASFGNYRNFVERGKHFQKLVEEEFSVK